MYICWKHIHISADLRENTNGEKNDFNGWNSQEQINLRQKRLNQFKNEGFKRMNEGKQGVIVV